MGWVAGDISVSRKDESSIPQCGTGDTEIGTKSSIGIEQGEKFALERTENNSLGLRDLARRLGFELVGVSAAGNPETYPDFLEWIDSGYAASMDYLPKRKEAYAHPAGVLEGVRSVVMLGMNYHTCDPLEDRVGKIARYASGSVDYHQVFRDSISEIVRFLKGEFPGSMARGIVDTAPLLERDFARRAGLGWFGKNTMLINKKMGSWFFLGAVLTDVPLEADPPHHASHCGTCRACLEVCPTNAFPEPYVLDANRCIAYLTIEHKSQIAEDLRPLLDGWLFGCDLCQEVCPWNRKSPRTTRAEYLPREDLEQLDASTFLQMSDAEFLSRFRGTPLERTGRAVLARTAAILLGNTGDQKWIPLLREALNDHATIVREAAQWALGRL